MTPALTVASLHVHPVKSCRAVDLETAPLDALGMLHDRRWMVVDAATGRMTLIAPRLVRAALALHAPDMPVLELGVEGDDAAQREVTVWRFTGPADECGDDAARWVSAVLGRPCRLVRFARNARREVNPAYARSGALTAFTDGYPLGAPVLLGTQEYPAAGGRYNLAMLWDPERGPVATYAKQHPAPFAEDTWRRIRVGEVELDVVKPGERCAITTVDPLPARRGREPLATLATFRRREGAVWFGQNCVHRAPGAIRVGDPVEVLEARG